jgi:beta-glucosidase
MDGAAPGPEEPAVAWPSAECQARTAGLLAMMTPAEKAAQMVMAIAPTVAEVRDIAPGAVFSGGSSIPPGGYAPAAWVTMVDGYMQAAAQSRLAIPIFYGVDALHGNNKATGTVIFPHNIGLGSTRDPALVQEVAALTALEVAATGVTWTFGPMVSVSFDDRWGRVYESFSEDPILTGQLGAAAVRGLQGAQGLGTGRPGIVACAKHFAGDGQATAGTSTKTPTAIVDRGDIRIDEAAMRKLGIGPYLPALRAGLGSIMVSDATWNGASLTSSHQIMTEILKGELNFKGFIATDWNAATTNGGTIVGAVNAGVDMLMHPVDWQGAITTIAAGVPVARMNDAVTRILNVKCQSGLFGWQRDPALLGTLGSAEHRAVGRRAVRQSLVLLQNNATALPVAKASTVWVGGSGANNLTNQCGGWTITWQGTGSLTQGTTISQALAKVTTVVPTMAQADTVVVVLSEGPYAEFTGDRASIDTLPPADFTLLDQARASGKKVVAVIISGRPVLIASHLAAADAWVAAWLPGTEGDGIADFLVGDHAPTGKLSHSWPRTQAQAAVNVGDPGYDPLFPIGHGLTY